MYGNGVNRPSAATVRFDYFSDALQDNFRVVDNPEVIAWWLDGFSHKVERTDGSSYDAAILSASRERPSRSGGIACAPREFS
jgi:hypothetical protein